MEKFPMPEKPRDQVYERVKKEMQQMILENDPELKNRINEVMGIMERDYKGNKETMKRCIENMKEDIDPAEMERKWAKLFLQKAREEITEQRMAA